MHRASYIVGGRGKLKKKEGRERGKRRAGSERGEERKDDCFLSSNVMEWPYLSQKYQP